MSTRKPQSIGRRDGPSVAQRDARLKAVCRFVRHVRVEDARHELPPVNHFGARKTRRSPHICSAAEIDRLIEAAFGFDPKAAALTDLCDIDRTALRHGLRISEALKLTVADVTRDGLLIRDTKFQKTRLVPLHDTAVAGLKGYLARRRPCSETDPVFVDARGLPLRYTAAKRPSTGWSAGPSQLQFRRDQPVPRIGGVCRNARSAL
ncbi:tyrosine-type recombinase/integrase [Mesorhizobium australicum]|uniref:tyrosine-type recombinase/integrase n=1 Tax=Mesorhizobium australicum TaxID=536018 RepID=UPI00333629CF